MGQLLVLSCGQQGSRHELGQVTPTCSCVIRGLELILVLMKYVVGSPSSIVVVRTSDQICLVESLHTTLCRRRLCHLHLVSVVPVEGRVESTLHGSPINTLQGVVAAIDHRKLSDACCLASCGLISSLTTSHATLHVPFLYRRLTPSRRLRTNLLIFMQCFLRSIAKFNLSLRLISLIR